MVVVHIHDHSPDALAHFVGFADLIITEGYKRGPYPKIEVFRPEATGDSAPLCTGDPQLLAIISDAVIESRLPVFGTADFDNLFEFIKDWHSAASATTK